MVDMPIKFYDTKFWLGDAYVQVEGLLVFLALRGRVMI